MTTSTDSPQRDHLATMSTLKETARCAQDLELWLSKNLWACGLTDMSEQKTGVVNLGFSIHTALQEDSENPAVKVNVAVSVQDHARQDTHASLYFNMEDDLASTATANFRMFLSFADWPFLTAHLALLSLQDQVKVTPLSAPRVGHLLTKFIPEHFPGMTWSGLQAMYAGDMLPLLFENRLDEPATLEILFARRVHQTVVALPESLTL